MQSVGIRQTANVGFVASIRGIHTWPYNRRRQGYTEAKYEHLSSINRLSAISLAAGFSLWAFTRPKQIRADSAQKAVDEFDALGVENARNLARSKSPGKYLSNEPDHEAPGQPKPPSQSPVAENEKTTEQKRTWNSFMSSLSDIKWSTLPDKVISGVTVPEWIRLFPAFMTKFQNELSMAPGSLAEEIWREANDPEINPEIMWDARVRVSDELCPDEKTFIRNRKQHTIKALAKYLDIPESDIHPEDVPTIAMCGSGGGLRALVAGAGSYISAREAGLFDCITYTAGVSGSCWLQTLYFSSLGRQNYSQIIQHLKNRLGVHLAYPPAAFNLINSAPTNKFLLTGLVEKFKGTPDADFGIVDVYGMLLAGRLLVPKAELGIDLDDLKISNQARYIDRGQNPIPIYTAVRHEIPITEDGSVNVQKAKEESWFQWFEFTPFEFFCEEVGAGIPIWAMGRQFENGKTVWRQNGLSLPESRVPLLMGIWGSAFCATLSHYYKEIQPVMKGLAGFGGIDQMIAERDEDLIKVHPIDPAALPNFAHGMKGLLPTSCPKSLLDAEYLQLMDAGMSNNLPIYPLLRPGRNVDVIIAFDNSADVKQDNWLRVVDGYAKQRNITGWPVGAGWPPNQPRTQVEKDLDKAVPTSADGAEEKFEQAKNDDTIPRDLGHCNIWVGNIAQRTADREPPPSKLVNKDWDTVMDPDAGITVVYFPLLTNSKVPGVDPKKSDYLSTWNFVYSPSQIDSVVALAKANFEEGKEQTKRTIRAVYDRKRKIRLEREREAKYERRARKLRSGVMMGRKLGEGDHGNHFS